MSAPSFAALDCHGTEPFWNAKVSDKSIELKELGTVTFLFSITKTNPAQGYKESFIKNYSNDNGPIATVTSRACDNGMSEEIFPKEFSFIRTMVFFMVAVRLLINKMLCRP